MSAEDIIISTVWDKDVQTLMPWNMKGPTSMDRLYISFTAAYSKGMLNNLHFHHTEGWQQLLLVLLTAGSLGDICKSLCFIWFSFLFISMHISSPLYFLTPPSPFAFIFSNVFPVLQLYCFTSLLLLWTAFCLSVHGCSNAVQCTACLQ